MIPMPRGSLLIKPILIILLIPDLLSEQAYTEDKLTSLMITIDWRVFWFLIPIPKENHKCAHTTEAWGELCQTQGVEIRWLSQLQDLQMLLKDLLPLLENIRNETNQSKSPAQQQG